MKKVLILTVILTLGLASLAIAGPPPWTPWKCATYDGFVWNYPQDPGLVIEDTAVFVNNPNKTTVKCWMRIFNKNGVEVWSGYLWDTTAQRETIPVMGFNWMSLGWALAHKVPPYITVGREKFTYLIYMSKPPYTPYLKCSVEVKQLMYVTYVPSMHLLGDLVLTEYIRDWTETAVEHWYACPAIP